MILTARYYPLLGLWSACWLPAVGMGRKRTAAAEPGGASPRWPRVSQGQPSRRPLRTRPRPAREGTRPGRSGTSTSLSWGHSLNKRHPDDRPLHPALFPSGQPGDAIPSCAPPLAYFLFFIAIVYILIYVRLICWHSDSSNLLVQSCPSGCVRQPTLLINNKVGELAHLYISIVSSALYTKAYTSTVAVRYAPHRGNC